MLLSQLGANASTASHAIPGFPNGLVGLPSAQMGQNPLNQESSFQAQKEL